MHEKSVRMTTDAEFRARSKVRYQKHKEAIVKRNKLVGVSSLFCVFFYVAFHSEVMTGTGTYYQQSYINVAQNAAGGCTWALYTAGKLYNTTYTGVSVWIYNTTPTNATAASVAAPPAPPKEAPTSQSESNATPPEDAPPLDSDPNDAKNKTNSTNKATTDSDSETDSSYTVLEVAGDVAVNVVSFVCGFTGFMFMMAIQQG